MERRDFLRWTGFGTAAAVGGFPREAGDLVARALADLTDGAAQPPARFWSQVRTHYTHPGYIDFDQANCTATARPVLEAFLTRMRFLAQAPANRFEELYKATDRPRKEIAALLGVSESHFAFQTNATSGLNTVLRGFPLERGDEILVTNHEYPDMVETIRRRADREGLRVTTVQVPGADEDHLALVSRVEAAMTSRTRLLLVSHISAWSGEVLPVAEITRAARARGVAVLVDAAQSVGLLDVHFDRIGCDFLATSLHKWFGAPVNCGVLAMRPEWVERVVPLHPPSWDTSEYPMDLYEWSGTFNIAVAASLADAAAFQRTIGAERKRARLRELGARWQDAVRGEPRVQLLTPRTAHRWAGPASFAMDGIPSKVLARHLHQRRGVLVQDKSGRHSPFANALRVSPGFWATTAEVDRFVQAVRDVARRGLPA